MDTFVLIIIIILIAAWQLTKCQKQKDKFLPTKTWDDWDNYDKDYGNTRAYWGSMDPEGGWTGNPHAPGNDPSGYGFGATTPDYGRARYGRGAYHHPRHEINLATASEDELASEYRIGIMSTK